MAPERQADLALALEGARRAAAAVAAQFNEVQEVRYKSPEQPVTAADLVADAILREVLMGARPGYGWLSEESLAQPVTSAHGRLWAVDPIDGTSSFVAGIPEFGVSVGLVERGSVVLGVVANPGTGDVYWASAGGGALLNGAPLRAPTAPRGRLVVSRGEQRRGVFGAFDAWQLVPCGSTTIKMCRVAEGSADAFVSFGPKHVWDVCAADLIVREAGGRVTDLAGRSLSYRDPHRIWTGLVVGHPAVHPELLALAGG